MREIFVTNRNDFHHVDRYDGVEFEFPPSVRVAVPVDAAVHMFGFNMPDKTEVLVRLGWATRYDPAVRNFVDDPDGVKKLARFVFTKGVMVEEAIDAPAEIDEPGASVDVTPARKQPKGAVAFLQEPSPLV